VLNEWLDQTIKMWPVIVFAGGGIMALNARLTKLETQRESDQKASSERFDKLEADFETERRENHERDKVVDAKMDELMKVVIRIDERVLALKEGK